MMIRQVFLLMMITLVPALELRASIPWGILGNKYFSTTLTWPWVVLVCIVTNILLGWAVFWAMGPAFGVLDRWVWFRRRIEPIIQRTQRRLHPYVEKYGELGVAVFIGVPLPGSGVYTGAFGAFLLGVSKRKFAVANVIGVLIAGTIVTILCLMFLAAENVPDWLHWVIKPSG